MPLSASERDRLLMETHDAVIKIITENAEIKAKVKEHDDWIDGNGNPGAKSRMASLETREKEGCPAIISLSAQVGETTKKKDRSIGMWVSISLIAITQILDLLFGQIPFRK